jgi:hypothetical protein
VEQSEPYRLLELRITLDSHVSAGPELVEVCPLFCKQMLQAGVPGTRQRGGDLVAQRRGGSKAGPPVAEEFHNPEPLPRLEAADECNPRPVLHHRALRTHFYRRLDEVIHAGRHLQPRQACAVQQHRPAGVQVLVQG